MTKSTRFLLAASLAGVLVTPLIGASNANAKQDKGSETVHCYGVNKCKGVGECGGKGHSCKGQNACKRQGYIDMDKDTCLKLDGGRLTAEEPSK
ncbi:MAG TPA: hypothetical protein VNI57_14685 [Candidatus Saccharimonadales bacterium]|nr:hypothetical protein [Candidatus Saccharimonadales bacterium]